MRTHKTKVYTRNKELQPACRFRRVVTSTKLFTIPGIMRKPAAKHGWDVQCAIKQMLTAGFLGFIEIISYI